jgi:hypothetical protein
MATWTDVATGKTITTQRLKSDSKITILDGPPGNNDKVLKLKKVL